MTDETRGRLEFVRSRIAMAESRMDSLALSFRGWNTCRIIRSWVDNALRPAREALDEILGADDPPPSIAAELDNVA